MNRMNSPKNVSSSSTTAGSPKVSSERISIASAWNFSFTLSPFSSRDEDEFLPLGKHGHEVSAVFRDNPPLPKPIIDDIESVNTPEDGRGIKRARQVGIATPGGPSSCQEAEYAYSSEHNHHDVEQRHTEALGGNHHISTIVRSPPEEEREELGEESRTYDMHSHARQEEPRSQYFDLESHHRTQEDIDEEPREMTVHDTFTSHHHWKNQH